MTPRAQSVRDPQRAANGWPKPPATPIHARFRFPNGTLPPLVMPIGFKKTKPTASQAKNAALFRPSLEERGIKVCALPLGNVAGLAVRATHPGRPPVPVVVVNADDWGERQRFTIGRELGHLVLDVARSLDGKRVEHRFVGAFLMPADALRLELGRRRSAIALGELLALKPVFGVSIQALARRCRDLDIINQSTCRRLFSEFDRLGWRSPPYEEYGAFAGERPNRFHRLCLRALAEGAISESKAAELLNVGIAALDQHMQAVSESPSTS